MTKLIGRPSRAATASGVLVATLALLVIAGALVRHQLGDGTPNGPFGESIETVLIVGAVALAALLMIKRRYLIEELRETQARHDALFESAPDGIITVDESGTILSANVSALSILGYAKRELEGHPLDLLIPPQLRDEHHRMVAEVASGQRDISHLIGVTRDVEAVRKDGSLFPIEVTVTVAWASGKRFFSAVFRDVSDRKEAELRLRENQRAMSTLLSNLPGMAFRCLLDENWTMLFASQGTKPLTGYEPHELIHSRAISFAKVIHPEDRALVSTEIHRAVRENAPFQLSYRIAHADGEIRWVWEQGQGVPGHHGKVRCVEGFITDITKQKRIEESLRESEQRFRSIADATPLMIWATGLDRTVTFANARVMEFTGLSLDDLLGKGWFTWTHPEDTEEATRAYSKAFEKWQPLEQQYRARRHDGEWRWLQVHGTPRFAPGGEFVGYIGTAKDVTESKHAIDALQESEERFRRLADCSPSIVWVEDQDGICTFLSKRWTEFTGLTMEQSLGKGWRDAIMPGDLEEISQRIRPQVDCHQPYHVEYRVRGRDGRYGWFFCSAVPRFDATGQFEGYVGAAVDITDRKIAEDSLRESEERFRKLADASPNIIWIMDQEAQCLFVSRAWSELTGQTLAESRGRGWLTAVHQEDRPRVSTDMMRCVETRRHFTSEYRVRTQSGSYRWILDTGHPRIDENGQFHGYVGSAVDITERKEAETLLNAQHSRLASIHRLTESAVRGDTLRTIYDRTMEELSQTLGADRSSILLFDATGTMRFVGWRGLSDEYRAAVEGHSPWKIDDPDPQPLLVPDAGIDETFAIYRPLFDRENIRALAFFPLVSRGQLLGKFMLYYREPHEFTSEESDFARHLAGQLANTIMRERAFENLQQRELSYRRLFEDSPIGLIEQDYSLVKNQLVQYIGESAQSAEAALSGEPEKLTELIRLVRTRTVNKAALQIMGVDTQEDYLASRPALQLEKTRQAYKSFFLAASAGCTSWEGESCIRTRNGQIRHLVVRVLIVPGHEENWDRVITSLIDVTAQKMMDDALRASEQRYRRLFDESPLAKLEVDLSEVRRTVEELISASGKPLIEVVAQDPEFLIRCLGGIRIMSVNTTTLRMFQTESLEQLQRRIASVFTEATMGAFCDYLTHLSSGERTFQVETEFRRLDNALRIGRASFVRMTESPDDWSHILVAMSDITESKHAADALARARRLETAGCLAGQIAHDFNNLLGPLVAYPEILKAKFPVEGRAQEMLGDMESAALQIAEINQQLLTLGRRGHYNVEPLDLNNLVESAVRTVELPDSIRVSFDFSPCPLTIRGGKAQLMRVFVNLVSNAAEAMDHAGALSIDTGHVHLAGLLGRYSDVPPGEYARVEVTDTGCGIPDETLEHIFEPFFTTKNTDRQRGSGLGLSVVHSVVEDHDGFVDVRSVPGVGTTFSLYFPLIREDAAAGETLTTIVHGSGERVLVVDDDPFQRRIVQMTLEGIGYKVTALESGERALSHIADHPHEVVVVDMVMGGIDGAETLRRIREMYPDQRGMILTGYSTSERARAALALGNCELLAKPIQVSALTGAIRRAITQPLSDDPGELPRPAELGQVAK